MNLQVWRDAIHFIGLENLYSILEEVLSKHEGSAEEFEKRLSLAIAGDLQARAVSEYRARERYIPAMTEDKDTDAETLSFYAHIGEKARLLEEALVTEEPVVEPVEEPIVEPPVEPKEVDIGDPEVRTP